MQPRRPNPGPPRRFGVRLAIILGTVAAIFAVAATLSPRQLSDWDWGNAVPLVAILVFMVARLSVSPRALGTMGKQALTLLAFGAALTLGYAYRDDLSDIWGRMMGTVVPGHGVEVAPGILRFQAGEDGQFFIDAKVDGVGVHFLVDTGASGIALSQRDAGRLGFDAHELDYTTIFSTANGTTRGAPVTLDKIEIGPLEADHVRAWVNEGQLDESLLGMSYLRTLGRIEIRGDTLIVESASGKD